MLSTPAQPLDVLSFDVAGVAIESASGFPQWLETIAHWHVEGFERSHQPKTTAQQTSHFERRHALLLAQVVTDEIPVTYVAHTQGQMLGCISLLQYQRLGGMPPSHWVANVFVDQPFRCRGLSERMLHVMEEKALRNGVAELFLYATDQVGYYRNRGWQEVRKKTVNGFTATIMRKSLCAVY